MASASSSTDKSFNSIPEVDDINMFQAARRNGRRNALADLGEQLSQANTSIQSPEVDQLSPHFQSMSIKH
ncbi:unnamed protein product [Adineta steineri]|uniref:Uncharacterized protein n=1 Tax=Adineta steineri TaxID=433720 RepID=A0A815RVB4_9BILA|nr:unnamed protein product [Adineta steineri]CAF1638827.1 unnamed protein product [Adineta steineri]